MSSEEVVLVTVDYQRSSNAALQQFSDQLHNEFGEDLSFHNLTGGPIYPLAEGGGGAFLPDLIDLVIQFGELAMVVEFLREQVSDDGENNGDESVSIQTEDGDVYIQQIEVGTQTEIRQIVTERYLGNDDTEE